MTGEKDYFKSFYKISQAFGTAASESELLDLIVGSAIETMNGKAACLYLADEKTDAFVPVAQKGLSDKYLHANPMKAKRIVDGILGGGYLAFKDATTDPRLENHEAKKAEGIASILTVPVRVSDRTVGILSLYTATTREFDKGEIQFLDVLADQGGVALHKTRLLERIQRNAQLYLDLSAQINSTLDIKEILNNMTIEVSKALGMKGAAIRLLDSETDTLKLVASYGLSEAFLDIGQFTSTETAARALKGETLVIEDALTDKRIQHKDALKKEGVGSIIITPIKAKDTIIGTLRLYNCLKRKFPEDMLVLVQALAHQGGLAIQNASMYLALQEDKKNLEEEVWSHRMWF
jgi:GAF domain-containing protein